MPQVLIDIDDEFIDWEGWARKRFASAGIHIENADLAGAQDFANGEGVGQPLPERDATPAEQPADPWAANPSGAANAAPSSTASRPAASAPSGRPASPPRDGYTYKDDRGNVHTFNKAGAPPCEHGQPAVHVAGKSEKTGKPWRQYRCALSSTDRWSDKCEFQQWA